MPVQQFQLDMTHSKFAKHSTLRCSIASSAPSYSVSFWSGASLLRYHAQNRPVVNAVRGDVTVFMDRMGWCIISMRPEEYMKRVRGPIELIALAGEQATAMGRWGRQDSFPLDAGGDDVDLPACNDG